MGGWGVLAARGGVFGCGGFRGLSVGREEQPGGPWAGSERGQAEMERFLGAVLMASVSARIRAAGFAAVTLDTKGYRRGSLNEGIPEETLANG